MTPTVGDTVYDFDENRRVYGKGRTGPPIYRGHFRACRIIGDDGRGWRIVHGLEPGEKVSAFQEIRASKVAKYLVGGEKRKYHTAEQMEEAIWMHDNHYKIVRAIEQCRDVEKIRQVAKLIGYDSSAA